MHLSLFSTLLAAAGTVSAATIPTIPIPTGAPALPVADFTKNAFVKLLTPEEMLASLNRTKPNVKLEPPAEMRLMATCTQPRIRQEWDSYSNGDRQAFVNAIKCLMGRPASGQFAASRSRYEDLVALHQTLTPNVHQNSKFLIWHRYYLWTFEDMLRQECGFNRAFPWFDETKYAGRFAQSSIFSNEWFGAIALNFRCVTNGQFANLAINIGPGTSNQPHCLARAGDGAKTAECNQRNVDLCNANGGYAAMASCAEGGPHAYGHNGIGAVMQDTWASPADPVFWLHHAFIDRNYRIWQNADRARVGYVDGTDRAGNRLTLDTNVNVYGIRPDVKIRDILDTQGDTLCYRYNY